MAEARALHRSGRPGRGPRPLPMVARQSPGADGDPAASPPRDTIPETSSRAADQVMSMPSWSHSLSMVSTIPSPAWPVGSVLLASGSAPRRTSGSPGPWRAACRSRARSPLATIRASSVLRPSWRGIARWSRCTESQPASLRRQGLLVCLHDIVERAIESVPTEEFLQLVTVVRVEVVQDLSDDQPDPALIQRGEQ